MNKSTKWGMKKDSEGEREKAASVGSHQFFDGE